LSGAVRSSPDGRFLTQADGEAETLIVYAEIVLPRQDRREWSFNRECGRWILPGRRLICMDGIGDHFVAG